MKHRLYLYDGVKAQSIDDLDQWMDATQAKGTGEHDVYEVVPWVYRCVRLRANALSAVPRSLRRGEDAIEAPLDYLLPRLLWLTEAALCIYGAAYWLRVQNRARVQGYRWLLPTSIEIVSDEINGLTGFKRRIGAGQPILYKPEQLVYFWEPNLKAEVGPGVSPVHAGLTAANLGKYANQFASGFFERGAIPATLLSIEGNPPKAELERLEEWWKRMLQGVRHAWETVAVRASVKPQVIGQPIKDLAMTELTASARQQIAVALGIPQTMIEDAANYASAKEHRLQFYENTIIPECGLVAGALNEQVYKAQGLEFAFTPQDLDVMQEDESRRADSLKRLVEAGLPLILALQMLGYDLPEGWDYARLERELEKEAANKPPVPAVLMQNNRQPLAWPEGAQPAVQAQTVAQQQAAEQGKSGKAEPDAAMLDDLRRWQRKATKKGGPVPFESAAIPAPVVQAVKLALETIGLDAFLFLKADRRTEIERRLKQAVGDVFDGEMDAIVSAILAGQDPDLSAFSAAMRARIQPELANIAYDVLLSNVLSLGVGFDPVRMNLAALEWAASYATKWVMGLTETRRNLLREVLREYLSTPGLNNADIVRMLQPSFGAVSAEMIAVTEVTRAYSAATNVHQKLLAEMGINMTRVWNTSNDATVCVLCGPLHEKPEAVWGMEFPDGPPRHVNCRCSTGLEVIK